MSSPPPAGPGPMTMALLVFHGLTLLDFAGPYEVLMRVPGATVVVVSAHPGELVIRTEHGLQLVADVDIDSCPPDIDLLLVPGGPGQLPLMEDANVLGFIRDRTLYQGRGASNGRPLRYLTSVCTGALVAAAGVLLQHEQQPGQGQGQQEDQQEQQQQQHCSLPGGLTSRVRATTHWLFVPLLEALGVEATGEERVVWCDVRTRVNAEDEASAAMDVAFTLVTGGGVTAGLDFGLALVKRVYGPEVEQAIRLSIQYEPEPPAPRHLRDMPAAVVDKVKAAGARLLERRWAAVRRIRQRLGLDAEGAMG